MIKQLYRFFHPRFQNLFLEYKVDLRPRYGHGRPPHPELYALVNARRKEYMSLLERSLGFKEQLQGIRKAADESDASLPGWNNGYLPGLDIVGIYTMLSVFRPKIYLEVGSGNSTKVAFKAKTEQELDMEILSIDPHPRAEIDHLSDRIIRKPFESLDLSTLPVLGKNDILFIDNSHRILPNSDATVFFMEVLPRLAGGVLVHVHDIYLPYDYPQFMCDRFYSEQYGLASYLLANPERFQPVLPNYFISEDPELKKVIEPMWHHPNLEGVERHGGSFWLRIEKD